MTTRGVISRALQLNTENIRFPKAEGYGARIGDLWVRLAVGPERALRYYTKDSLAGRQDFKGLPGENVLDIGYTWARTELNGGEGLDWDPRQLSSDETAAARDLRRFWDSKNINVEESPAGIPYSMKLTHTLELWNEGFLNEVKDIAASATHVFIADGSSVFSFVTWDDGTPLQMSVGTTAFMLAANPGDEVMCVNTNGDVYYREADAGAFNRIYTANTPITNSPMKGVWFAKGRFVGFRQDASGENGELGELLQGGVDDGSNFVTFDTVGDQTVTAVVSTGPSIVAAVTDGTLRSYVPEQGNQSDPSSVNLVIRGRTDLPKGEIPSVLGANAGILTILTISTNELAAGTTTRFYRAEALSAQYDYVVGGLQLQREWFDTAETVDLRANMTSTRDAIWFAVTESDGNTYLWRYDVTTFGLSRGSEVFAGAVGYSTTLFDGKGALVNDAAGLVYLETDEYHQQGYMISPNITFGLNTDIAWISSVIEAHELDTNTYVELWRSTDPEAINDPNHPSWQNIQRIASPSKSGTEIDMLNANSRTMALQLKLYSNGTKTPSVTRVATRGIPTHRDWIVHLPVNVSDIVEVPGRAPLRVPSLGDDLHRELLDYVGRHLELIVLDPPLYFRGVVDAVEEPVEYISDRGSVSVYVMLQFRGQRATATIQPVGDAGLGLGLLGVATMGIGQTIEEA